MVVVVVVVGKVIFYFLQTHIQPGAYTHGQSSLSRRSSHKTHKPTSISSTQILYRIFISGFVPVPTRVRVSLAGLGTFLRFHNKYDKEGEGPKFIHEVDTITNGQAPYVVSKKRRNYYELQSAEITSDLRNTYLDLKYVYDSVGLGDIGDIQLNPADKKILEAALGLGIFSFINVD